MVRVQGSDSISLPLRTSVSHPSSTQGTSRSRCHNVRRILEDATLDSSAKPFARPTGLITATCLTAYVVKLDLRTTLGLAEAIVQRANYNAEGLGTPKRVISSAYSPKERNSNPKTL